MEFTLNGRPASVDVRDGATLLDALREGAGLVSMKDGCAPEGSCGACTVIVEGKAVVSCAQPARRFEGREVTTQEGLTTEQRDTWAHAFVAAGASQCGFCWRRTRRRPATRSPGAWPGTCAGAPGT